MQIKLNKLQVTASVGDELNVSVKTGGKVGVNIYLGYSTVANSYNTLSDKPKINDIELVGNKTLAQLGIEPKRGVDDFYVTGAEKNQGALSTGNAALDTVKKVADKLEILNYNKIIDLDYDVSTPNSTIIDLKYDSKGNLLSSYNLRKISFYAYLETNATTTGKRLGISVNNILTSTYKQTTNASIYILGRIGASGVYRIDLSIIGGILYFRITGLQSSTKIVDSTSVSIGAVDGINQTISSINSVQLLVLPAESVSFNGKIKILGIYE